MEFDTASPIWMQVATRIKTEMVTRKLPPGAKLPGGRELALQYTINPNTAARVYQELEAEGLCVTRRGLGTFVTENREKLETIRQSLALEAVDRYLRQLEKLGLDREDAVRLIQQTRTADRT